MPQDPHLAQPLQGLDWLRAKLQEGFQGGMKSLRGPDPMLGGAMELPGAAKGLLSAGPLQRLLGASQQAVQPAEQGLQAGRNVFLHTLRDSGDGTARAVLSHEVPLSADEFKQAFLGNLPKGMDVEVQRLQSGLRPKNQHMYRMDFHQSGRTVKAPADFYKRFGAEGPL